MALVNAQFEWKEKDWNSLLCSFTDLELLDLAVVRVRDRTSFRVLLCHIFGSFDTLFLFLLSLFSSSSGIFDCFFICTLLLRFLIDYLHVEKYILRETILYLEVDLEWLIKLSGLWYDVNRVPLIDIRNELKYQCCCLHVTLFPVSEDNFSLDLA